MIIDRGHLGTALEAIRQTIEYEHEWGAKDYDEDELEAKLADLEAAYDHIASYLALTEQETTDQ